MTYRLLFYFLKVFKVFFLNLTISAEFYILLRYNMTIVHHQNKIHISQESYTTHPENNYSPFTFCTILHQACKMSVSGFACLLALSLLRIQQMEPWDGGYQPSHSPLDCNSLSTMCYGP